MVDFDCDGFAVVEFARAQGLTLGDLDLWVFELAQLYVALSRFTCFASVSVSGFPKRLSVTARNREQVGHGLSLLGRGKGAGF